MSFKASLLLLIAVTGLKSFVYAFHLSSISHATFTTAHVPKQARSCLYMNNFFKDLMENAFANDESLPSDKEDGQLESGDDDGSSYSPRLTATQERWKKQQQSTGRAPPVTENVLIGSKWTVGLFLAGIPDKDPSNDLYGRRVNMSNRDKTLGIGAQIDKDPNVFVDVTLAADGVCRTSSSDFTSGEDGEWKLSPDNTYIRFCIDSLGFTKTIQTTGTINKIYWSKEDDLTTKTSSTYSIPPIIVFADAKVGYGSKPGQFVMKEGTLMFQKTSGLLGASSKMVICGKFSAEMVTD